jgi:hypothetical protein
MIYSLMIWTVVAMAGEARWQTKAHDWRPIAEFHVSVSDSAANGALLKCETAAKQLAIDPKFYRCIKLK